MIRAIVAAVNRLRFCIATLAVGVVVSCGASPDSPDAALTDLPADVHIDVVGEPDTELCFEATIESLDVLFERRCYTPPHALIIAEAGTQLVESDDPLINSATLMVTPYPLRVTSVEQKGEGVLWQQDGGGIVIIGRIVPNADTTIEFELDGAPGTCEYRPDRESCQVG